MSEFRLEYCSHISERISSGFRRLWESIRLFCLITLLNVFLTTSPICDWIARNHFSNFFSWFVSSVAGERTSSATTETLGLVRRLALLQWPLALQKVGLFSDSLNDVYGSTNLLNMIVQRSNWVLARFQRFGKLLNITPLGNQPPNDRFQHCERLVEPFNRHAGTLWNFTDSGNHFPYGRCHHSGVFRPGIKVSQYFFQLIVHCSRAGR